VQKGTGRSGPDLYQACLRKGAVFRPLANYGMPHALRISINKPEENLFAARKLREVLSVN
jgi:histidinol-phosphate aminotransferase